MHAAGGGPSITKKGPYTGFQTAKERAINHGIPPPPCTRLALEVGGIGSSSPSPILLLSTQRQAGTQTSAWEDQQVATIVQFKGETE